MWFCFFTDVKVIRLQLMSKPFSDCPSFFISDHWWMRLILRRNLRWFRSVTHLCLYFPESFRAAQGGCLGRVQEMSVVQNCVFGIPEDLWWFPTKKFRCVNTNPWVRPERSSWHDPRLNSKKLPDGFCDQMEVKLQSMILWYLDPVD